MYNLILLFPLFGFFLSSLGGFYFGRKGSSALTCFGILGSFFLSIFVFYEVVLSQCVVTITLWNWFILDVYNVSIGMLFDSLTCIMLLVITSISSLVHIYAVGYMSEDPHLSRFMSYLSLFTFFMLFLVCSDNLIQLFIGWEGVGVCSYLLINFWYGRILANKAALKAMIVNRVADVLFVIGIILIFLTFKTTDFIIIFDMVHFILDEKIYFLGFFFKKINIISFFLLIGGLGKSAQIIFHTWLPDAMEGPTPVSALLHAATMVTAGVFLLIRCSFIFEYSPSVLILASLFGGITSFFTAIISTFQYDIKKVIAYSTCSQLGYMFFSCGLSNYQVAIFHLFNHAFFKALLFLSAGSVIHALADEQDMRRMGGLVNFLPFTYFCMFLGSLAIMGFPFLTGFYSKDLVLELAYIRFIIDGFFIYLLGVSAAFFTSVYSIRLLIFVFLSRPNLFRVIAQKLHESNMNMSFSMFILSFCSIFIGYLFSDAIIGWGSFFWGNSLFILPFNFSYVDADFISPWVKNMPIILSFFGIFFCFIIFYFFDSIFLKNRNSYFYSFLLKIFNFISPFFFLLVSLIVYIMIFFYHYLNFLMKLIQNLLTKVSLNYLGLMVFINFFFFYLLMKNLPPAVIFFFLCFIFLSLFFIYFFLIIFYMDFVILTYYNFNIFFLFIAMQFFDFKFAK